MEISSDADCRHLRSYGGSSYKRCEKNRIIREALQAERILCRFYAGTGWGFMVE